MPSITDQLPTWRLTEHVCRVCFGRVLERWQDTPDGKVRVVRCANCATELWNQPVTHLCCCGLKTSNGKDAGLRCRRNERPTPEQPAELAVAFGEPKAVMPRAPRKTAGVLGHPSLLLE